MITKNSRHLKRRCRIRKKVIGTQARPRVSVFRGQRHLNIQLVDDINAKTILSMTTAGSKNKGGNLRTNVASAKLIGSKIAAKAKEKGIAAVVFDRGGYRYHGRVKALAESLREAGLKF